VTELHDSHRWGEKDYEGDRLAYCVNCLVEGYEDEPAAFAPCPGPPSKPTAKPTTLCWRTYESQYLPGHTHLCELAPHEGDHICDDCGRRFGKR
jgi:hypothetical protein